MNQEIGSEFHLVKPENGKGIIFPRIGSLVFSGRTAIEEVLKQIPDTKTALLPSYCCDSMIEPFRRAGIIVKFYNVNYTNSLKFYISDTADVLLWCNYFGFITEIPKYDGLIIEDITHSLFSDISCHPQSDYLVASLRKWEPVYSGGYCSVNLELNKPPMDFIERRQLAMELKKKYLDSPEPEIKSIYLSLFRDNNLWLSKNYSSLSIDDFSRYYLGKIDFENQKKKRRDNANILYEGLKNKVKFIFPKETMDCPLFVPIIISSGRNEIRQKLIDNKIFCPIHWPHPNAKCESNLYEIELSLICDQRYSEDDMERIISVIKKII